MKSIFRLGAIGVVGSAIIGSTLGVNLRASALPQDQIVQKLGSVPVFTITDSKGAPLIASQPNQKNQAGVAGVFISQKDAQAFVEQLKKKDPRLGTTVKVVPVSLGEVYKLDQANQNKPNSIDVAYVPTKQQVDAAVTLLRQTGQKANQFRGTPLFVARAGKPLGYLTVKQGTQQVIPFFFNKEELQRMLERFKQQQPNIASTVNIQVVNLEGMLQTLQTRNDKDLSQIVLVPPQESVQFVRSLQPATGTNRNQQAAPKR